jgi:FAD/FMN-containing dehydrogenase
MAFAHKLSSVEQLQQQITGSVLTPDHPDYEQTRRAWDLSINQHPALILVPENADDVVAGVRSAKEAGLGIAVQSTGHGMLYPADDNLLIITSKLKGVHVDAAARTARAEAGVLWDAVIDAGTPHGLAPLLGSAPHVGVVGYTLGRGIGWLSRKYGFAADSVRSIDIVTADGVLRHASATENSDLFWGLLGGGGNFGVVTAMEFSLYPVATIYGGNLVYNGDLAGEALRFFHDWTKTLPDEMTSSIAVLKFPHLPQLPEALRGKTQTLLRAAYTGDAAEGEKLIQQWIDWHTPNLNTFREMPFDKIGTIQNDPVQPTSGQGTNEMLDELSDELIDVIVHYTMTPDSPVVFSEIRHAGGAMARVAPDTNAINHRDALYYMVMGGPTPTPELQAAAKAYLPKYKAAVRPFVRGGVYLNFTKGAEAKERIQDAFQPKTYERLLEVKAKYDPDNLFRYSYPLVASKA